MSKMFDRKIERDPVEKREQKNFHTCASSVCECATHVLYTRLNSGLFSLYDNQFSSGLKHHISCIRSLRCLGGALSLPVADTWFYHKGSRISLQTRLRWSKNVREVSNVSTKVFFFHRIS